MSAQDEGAAVAGYWDELDRQAATTVVGWGISSENPNEVMLKLADGSRTTINRSELSAYQVSNVALSNILRSR